MKRVVAITVMMLIMATFAMSVQAGPQPGTPEYAALKADEAMLSFDSRLFEQNACVDSQALEMLNQEWTSIKQEITNEYGVPFANISFDFSGLQTEVLEIKGNQARVHIFGPYTIVIGNERIAEQEDDILLVDNESGKWLMCGDQDLAYSPLPGSFEPQTKGNVAVADTAPIIHATKMVYEGGHSLDVDKMKPYQCITPESEQELRQAFEDIRQEFKAEMGYDMSMVTVDFSGIQYEVIEATSDMARVQISGNYIIHSPDGTAPDSDPDILLMQLIDGTWKMCGDQALARQPLSVSFPGAVQNQGFQGPTSSVGPTGDVDPLRITAKFFESAILLDYNGSASCLCSQMQSDFAILESEFAGARNQLAQEGVDWSKTTLDTSDMIFKVVESNGDRAVVNVSGTYITTNPKLGSSVETENQDFNLRKDPQSGLWTICDY